MFTLASQGGLGVPVRFMTPGLLLALLSLQPLQATQYPHRDVAWERPPTLPSQAQALAAPFIAMKKLAAANGMFYKGGPVQANPINVYLLFYGNWTGSSCGVTVLSELVRSFSDPSLASVPGQTVPKWWKVVTRYKQADGRNVSSQVRLAKVGIDKYSQGKELRTGEAPGSVWAAVRRALDAQIFPVDASGQYHVLTSADVTVGPSGGGGFCRSFCGFHSVEGYNGKKLLYGFTGDGSVQCPGTTCAMKMGLPGAATPNRCAGPDGMASTLLHELAEIATNPDFTAWTSPNNAEVADLCQRQYMIGAKWAASRQTLFNLVARKGYTFLTQSVMNPSTGKCAQTL